MAGIICFKKILAGFEIVETNLISVNKLIEKQRVVLPQILEEIWQTDPQSGGEERINVEKVDVKELMHYDPDDQQWLPNDFVTEVLEYGQAASTVLTVEAFLKLGWDFEGSRCYNDQFQPSCNQTGTVLTSLRSW